MKWIFISFFIVEALGRLGAQNASDQKYFIGGYYAFFITEVYPDGTNDSVSTSEQYIDINFRYALNRAWRVGVDYNLAFMNSEEVDDPFSTVGISLDYDFLRAKKSKLHIRAGLSFSNLSFTSNELPQKKFVINLLSGGSYEYRISNVLWVYAGLYHHIPLNTIAFKDPMVNPFVGVCIGI